MFRPIGVGKVLGRYRGGGGYLAQSKSKLEQNFAAWHIYLFRNTWITVWSRTFKLQIHICFIHMQFISSDNEFYICGRKTLGDCSNTFPIGLSNLKYFVRFWWDKAQNTFLNDLEVWFILKYLLCTLHYHLIINWFFTP